MVNHRGQMNGSETDSAAGTPVFPGQLGRLPILTVLAVFIPVILTVLTFKLVHGGARLFSPMIPFLVYAAWNWVVICIGYIIIRRRGVRWRDLGFLNFRYPDLGLAVVGALIGIFVVFPVAAWLARILGMSAIRGMSYSLTSPFDIVSVLVACVLLGPLAEDIIFRGYLLNTLRAKIANPWVVGFIGIVMFTLVHLPYFGWAGMLFIVLWSPVTVGLFLWRRNIYPSYVMHMLNNFFAYMVVPLFLR
jgi:membrane protease YdiL (CAAX protease family)